MIKSFMQTTRNEQYNRSEMSRFFRYSTLPNEVRVDSFFVEQWMLMYDGIHTLPLSVFLHADEIMLNERTNVFMASPPYHHISTQLKI